jgi:hypothetical protein
VGRVAYKRGMKNAYNILVGKQEGKRLLGKRRHRLEDNIKINLES